MCVEGVGKAPLFFTSALKVSGELYAPSALPPEKESPYPLDRKLGEPQSRSGRWREDENMLPLPGIDPGRPAPSLRTIQTWYDTVPKCVWKAYKV
jgi:hypothetical protein